MSQATFSRNIALLESELGATLFVRSNKNVVLTHEGELALSGMKKIENAYVEMLSEIQDFSKGISGSLSVGILEGQMLDPVLQTTIMRFEKEFPGIQLSLSRDTYRDLTDMLDAGKLDIAVTLAFDVRQRQELCWRSVCKLMTLLVMPASHRLAGKPYLRLIDFRNDVFIIPSEDDCKFCYSGLSENCIRSGFEPRILEAPDIRTQILWLEAGRGISAANPNHLMCNSPVLTEAAIPEFEPEDFVIAWHEQNSNPAFKCFLGIFEEIHAAACESG
jgi:DNA-binding transcriptional LysR family regulator